MACDAVNAVRRTLWMFVLHVNLQRLLVLVVPVTLGTLERLGGVVEEVLAQPRRVEDEVTLGTLYSGLSPGHMIRTGSDGGALQLTGVGWSVGGVLTWSWRTLSWRSDHGEEARSQGQTST